MGKAFPKWKMTLELPFLSSFKHSSVLNNLTKYPYKISLLNGGNIINIGFNKSLRHQIIRLNRGLIQPVGCHDDKTWNSESLKHAFDSGRVFAFESERPRGNASLNKHVRYVIFIPSKVNNVFGFKKIT